MAKQIAGLCFLEGTFDDLTFYTMDGQYYVRVKSSLSSQRVKTSPEFKWTMIYARLLARASKIGSAIYKELPPGWRQFWMYRSFTGEAFTLLKENPYSDEQVTQLLWKCYVEYWQQIKAADLGNPIWQAKPVKVRKRRKYSEESLLRKKDKYGKPLNQPPTLSITNKEIIHIAASLPAIIHAAKQEEPETPNPEHETLSPWQVSSDGMLQTIQNIPSLCMHTKPAIHPIIKGPPGKAAPTFQ
jgi:hypothetical protein